MENRIVPMIAYEDPAIALEWLATAFGFRERGQRFTEPDGRITHAEMELDGSLIMLANPTPHYQSPRRHRDECELARAWSSVPYVIDGLMVYVDDVDEHFRQATRAGARILSDLKDEPHEGIRRYRAEDVEGHRWMFAQAIE